MKVIAHNKHVETQTQQLTCGTYILFIGKTREPQPHAEVSHHRESSKHYNLDRK